MYTYLENRRMTNTVSERKFGELVHDIDDGSRDRLWDVWRDDLDTSMSKAQLVRNANGLLKYFGSKVVVCDVSWSIRGNCFLWTTASMLPLSRNRV